MKYTYCQSIIEFEPVQLNQLNSLPTTRIVCSKINETTRLTNIPRNKSLTFGIRMQTTDPNLSPVLDLQQTMFVDCCHDASR